MKDSNEDFIKSVSAGETELEVLGDDDVSNKIFPCTTPQTQNEETDEAILMDSGDEQGQEEDIELFELGQDSNKDCGDVLAPATDNPEAD